MTIERLLPRTTADKLRFLAYELEQDQRHNEAKNLYSGFNHFVDKRHPPICHETTDASRP